jgi:eukaryotic-like serine/threonine-protein kinase
MGRVEPGRVIAARYRLRGVIRRDKRGAIWLAHDGLRHEDVAVRAIPWVPGADAAAEEGRRERVLRETQALAQLDHPNIAGVLGSADDAGQPWLVLQAAPYRFPHRSLTDVVRTDGPLRPEQAAHVGWQVAAAIGQAHAAGVLHRDITPDSILLGAGNRVLLAGFGLVTADDGVALAAPEALTGSPFYMAPERARGEPATPWADLWSLGAALYAAVEGRVPFDRGETAAVLTAVIGGPPDPPRRSGPLWPVISGLLRKDPGARPDAAGVEWLLRRVAGRQGPALPPPPAGAPPPGTPAVPPPPGGPAKPSPAPPPGAGDTGSAADFIPGFGPRDPAAAAAG